MNPQGPQLAAIRAQERREKLQEWRERYSGKKYPEKVGINIVLEALVKEEEHSYYEKSFGKSKVNNLQEGIERVRSREKSIRDKVIGKAEKEFDERKRIGNLEVEGLRSKVKDAKYGDNEAVEDIEFSYVYYGIVYELFTGWYAAGICGVNREDAMTVMTGRTIKNISNIEAVEGFFGDYAASVLDQIDVYKPLPALW